MVIYADSSLLVSIYVQDAHTVRAIELFQRLSKPVIFTVLHRHEVRNALRLAAYRRQITPQEKAQAFPLIDSDLHEGILIHTAVEWRDAFKEAERLGGRWTEKYGIRSADLLHIATAVILGAEKFLTFDDRQAIVAKKEGLNVRP